MKQISKYLLLLFVFLLMMGLCACKQDEEKPAGDEVVELLLSDLSSYQIVRSDRMSSKQTKILLSFAEVLKSRSNVENKLVTDFTVVYPVAEKELVIGKTEREGSAYPAIEGLTLGEGQYDLRIVGSRIVFSYADEKGMMDGLEALLIRLFGNVEASELRVEYATALLKNSVYRYEGFHLNNEFQNGMHLDARYTLPCFGQGQAGLEVAVRLKQNDSVLKEEKTTVTDAGTWMVQLEPDQAANGMEILYNGVPMHLYTEIAFVDTVFPKPSDGTRVLINGKEVDVIETEGGLQVVASLSSADARQMDIEIIRPEAVEDCWIRPLSKGIQANISGNSVRFTVTSFPVKLLAEFDIDGFDTIMFFLHEYESIDLAAQGTEFRYFAPGEYWYEDANMPLDSGETIYLQEGARVHSRLKVDLKENISIIGRGIIDTFNFPKGSESNMMVFQNCKNVTLEDYFLTGRRKWMIVLENCDNVLLEDLSVYGTEINSDGVDVVGSRDVTITGCLFHTNDDCIAVKSHGTDVARLRVSNCVFKHGGAGAMEIGHETTCESISDIVFENNDALHTVSAVISINLADRAAVSNVTYRNIRAEEALNDLIRLSVQKTRYTTDQTRGSVTGVTIEGFSVNNINNFPLGNIKLIGYNDEHLIKDVLISGVSYNGESLKKEDLKISLNRYVRNIKFENELISES